MKPGQDCSSHDVNPIDYDELNMMKIRRQGTSESLSFSQKVKSIIKKIPRGKVATYGQIAMQAGNPRASRQVVWILNSSSQKDKLPWHRVVNGKGQISLKRNYGYEIQKGLLQKEGVKFDKNDTINFERYLWYPCSRLKASRH
jgi:methylated-DNA-protein-cysteine methyltransferase-like protein